MTVFVRVNYYTIVMKGGGEQMNTAQRRSEIMKILYQRTHESMSRLANELNVSYRTISRDIDILSLTYPIYTKTGRYEGGVYIMNKNSSFGEINRAQKRAVLQKIITEVSQNAVCSLSENEMAIIKNILKDYTQV